MSTLEGGVPVFKASELAAGAMRWVVIDRQRILIANVGGAFYAIRDMCGHRGAPMSTGMLTGYVLECPLHYATFDVRTGKLLSGPTSADIPTYEVRVEEDTVYVSRPRSP